MNNNEVRNSPGDDHDAMICQKSVFASPLLIPALIITGAVAICGLVDTARLATRAPLVGVFIARISKGRTIREFIVDVILVPTLFSILWFGGCFPPRAN